jgi:histidinol-phosphate aminotransferase
MADLSSLGFKTLASEAKFVFTTHASIKAELIYTELRKRDILIRYFNLPRIDNYLRITVGTDEECAKLIVALKEILV